MRLGLSNLGLCNFIRGGTPAEPTSPAAVSNLAAARGNQQAVLTWSAPSSGGSAITDYVVEFKLASEPTTWTTFSDGTSSSTGATVTSLTNGSEYNFRVKAVNAVGTGDASNTATATPATVPAAPSLSLTAGDGQISVAWTDGSTGGSAITSHKLYRGTTSGSLTLLGTILSSSPYVDNTVTNGTEYFYQISAVNDVGEGSLSTEQSETPAVAPVGTLDLRYNPDTLRREIVNIGDFGSPTLVWRDESGDVLVGETGSYLDDSVTDEGVTVEVSGDVATKSLLCFKGREYIDNLNIDLADVADGTTVASLGFVADAGFTVSGGKIVAPSKITTLIERRIHGTPGGALDTAASPLNMEIEATVENYDLGGASDGTYKSARTLFADYSSSTQRVYAESRGSLASVWKRASSGFHQLGTSNTSAIANGTTVLLRVHHINGVKYVTSSRKAPGGSFERYVTADTGPGQLVNGPGTAIPNGNSVALLGVNNSYSGSDYPLSLYQGELKTRSWAVQAINIYDITSEEPTLSAPLAVTVTGHTTVAGDHIAWLLDQYGREYADPVTVTPVSNEFTFVIPYTGDTPSKVRIAPVGDPSQATVEDILSLPIFEPLEAAVFGINSSPSGADSQADAVKDRGRSASWRYRTAAGSHYYVPQEDFNADGWPSVAPPSGYSLSCLLFEGNNLAGIRSGEWNVTTNAPCTIVVVDAANVTVTDITSTSCKITQASQLVTTKCWLRFDGVTVPPEGFQVSCLPVGDTSDAADHMTPEVAALWHSSNFGGEVWWRIMKSNKTEGVGLDRPYFAGTKEFAASVARQIDGHIHWNFPYLDVADNLETTVRTSLEYYRDNAPSTAKAAVAVANEVWNDMYDTQRFTMAARGATRGFVTGVTIPGGVTVTNEYYEADNNPDGAITPGFGDLVTPVPGKTRRVINPGEIFVCVASRYQNVLIKCIAASPVPIDTDVLDTTDSNFEVLAPFAGVKQAALREQAFQQKRLAILAQEVLGSRAVSVFETFLGYAASDIAQQLLWNDTYQYVDYWSPSFYSGGATSYADLAWAAQHTSDLAAFKAGFYAKLTDEADETVDKLKGLKHGVRRILLGAGLSINECPRMGFLYEGFDHNTVTNVPVEQRTGFIAAVVSALEDSGDRTVADYFNARLANEVGGVLVYFMDVEYPLLNTGVSGGQMQWFGIRRRALPSALNSNDATEHRYLSVVGTFGTP